MLWLESRLEKVVKPQADYSKTFVAQGWRPGGPVWPLAVLIQKAMQSLSPREFCRKKTEQTARLGEDHLQPSIIKPVYSKLVRSRVL